MLLELEAEVDREHTHHGNREVRKRKYEGLDAKTRVVGGQEQVVDRIVSCKLTGLTVQGDAKQRRNQDVPHWL